MWGERMEGRMDGYGVRVRVGMREVGRGREEEYWKMRMRFKAANNNQCVAMDE